jgi:hypothetical protein
VIVKHFTARQLLAFVAWLALVLSAFATKQSFVALAFTFMLTMSFYFLFRVLRKWRESSTRSLETVLLGIAFAVAAGGVATTTAMIWWQYVACAARSLELTSTIQQDPRFTRVVATYSDGGHVLTVTGHVKSPADDNALRAKAKEGFWGFKKTVRWRITVDRAAVPNPLAEKRATWRLYILSVK